MTEYLVPYESAESEFEEKRSRFISHVFLVESEAEARARIDEMKKKYYDARHNCWCFVLHDGTVRYGDDGEPQGTAGQPMLNVFQRENVENVVCIVTRYFGGILLGAGGLTRAYAKAAKDALDAAGKARMQPFSVLLLECPYPMFERIKLLIEGHEGRIESSDYGAAVTLTFLLPVQKVADFSAVLTELSGGQMSAEEVEQRLLPGYAAVGVGREDGAEAGEFSAVFYRRDRFTPLESGTFWLSETPDVAGSKGWDGACERVATWVVLHDREGGREFLFVNTHLDHVGQVARDEGVNLLRERIEALRGDRPVILTGDFNSEPGSSVVAHVQKDGVLHDVKQVAARKSGTEWSFSDFGQILEAERPLLDYIFVSDGIAADLYEVLPDTLGGGYVSDHAPVMAIVKFEK